MHFSVQYLSINLSTLGCVQLYRFNNNEEKKISKRKTFTIACKLVSHLKRERIGIGGILSGISWSIIGFCFKEKFKLHYYLYYILNYYFALYWLSGDEIAP